MHPTPNPIDPQVRIGHVHLKVADLERALRFYCGVLGFPHGVLAARVLAGRQEAVHVADDGDGAAFRWPGDFDFW